MMPIVAAAAAPSRMMTIRMKLLTKILLAGGSAVQPGPHPGIRDPFSPAASTKRRPDCRRVAAAAAAVHDRRCVRRSCAPSPGPVFLMVFHAVSPARSQRSDHAFLVRVCDRDCRHHHRVRRHRDGDSTVGDRPRPSGHVVHRALPVHALGQLQSALRRPRHQERRAVGVCVHRRRRRCAVARPSVDCGLCRRGRCAHQNAAVGVPAISLAAEPARVPSAPLPRWR